MKCSHTRQQKVRKQKEPHTDGSSELRLLFICHIHPGEEVHVSHQRAIMYTISPFLFSLAKQTWHSVNPILSHKFDLELKSKTRAAGQAVLVKHPLTAPGGTLDCLHANSHGTLQLNLLKCIIMPLLRSESLIVFYLHKNKKQHLYNGQKGTKPSDLLPLPHLSHYQVSLTACESHGPQHCCFYSTSHSFLPSALAGAHPFPQGVSPGCPWSRDANFTSSQLLNIRMKITFW